MSAYREFTGKSVEEALKAAREEFGVELNDLDFEILTAGSRGDLPHRLASVNVELTTSETFNHYNDMTLFSRVECPRRAPPPAP